MDTRTKNIVDDRHSSDYFSTRSCRKYNGYIRFANLVIEKEILGLLKALSSGCASENWLGISRVDTPVLHVSESTALLLADEGNF